MHIYHEHPKLLSVDHTGRIKWSKYLFIKSHDIDATAALCTFLLFFFWYTGLLKNSSQYGCSRFLKSIVIINIKKYPLMTILYYMLEKKWLKSIDEK
jgi:hypothetical protein